MSKKKMILMVSMIAAVVLLGGSAFYLDSMQYSAGYQLKQGYHFYEEKDYEKAILHFQKAIGLRPNQADGYVGTANVYIQLKKENEAASILESMSQKMMKERYREYTKISEGWMPLGELVIWYLDYNADINRVIDNEAFVSALETNGLRGYYSRQPAPEANRTGGDYTEEFILKVNSKNVSTPIYYTKSADKPTMQSEREDADGIRVLEGETTINAVAVDSYGVNSFPLTLEFSVELPALPREENGGIWMFDRYEKEMPYYEYEKLYKAGEATEQTRRTGRMKPLPDENGSIKEWKNEGYESAGTYREFERLYVNSSATEQIRYTGRTKLQGALRETLLSGYWRTNGMTFGVTHILKFYENGLFYEDFLNPVLEDETPDKGNTWELEENILKLYHDGELYDYLTYDGSEFVSSMMTVQATRDEVVNGVYIPVKSTELRLRHQKERY